MELRTARFGYTSELEMIHKDDEETAAAAEGKKKPTKHQRQLRWKETGALFYP